MRKVSFEKYKKRVESVKYRDFILGLSDVAKYPWEFMLEYKYKISCPNWEGSNMPGATIVFPAKPPFKATPYKGFTFDNRIQFTKTELQNWLKEVAEKVRYSKGGSAPHITRIKE